MEKTNQTEQRTSLVGDPAEILFRKKTINVLRGITVKQLMKQYPHKDDQQIVAAIINNRVVSLTAQILRSGTVDLVPVASYHGVRIYRRHLTMMLYEVFCRLFPTASMTVGQAILEGYYFEVGGVKVNDDFLNKMEQEMHSLAAQKELFTYSRVPVEEARRLFAKKGSDVKRQLLDRWPSSHVGVMGLRGFLDFCLGPVAPHTGYFKDFKLLKIGEDLVLQFPNLGGLDTGRNEGPQPKLLATLKQSRKWSKLAGVSNIAELNSAGINGSIREVILVAEGLHEKSIAEIAGEIASGGHKLIFVAGPSSAGKTTFAKRLSIQLQAVGLRPTAISLDNYYVDREKTPLDDKGEFDFEALEAIDLPTFNEHLNKMLDGKRVLTPVFNFQTGIRTPESKWFPVELKEHQVLIIEGIHGLNDALTLAVPPKQKFKIYINALNPLSIDEHNRLHTSDARLIRRLVRDRHYRGYSAAQTIDNWQSVRRGERKHIFPFQESANVIFDTSLIYEFSVLKIFAERYLLEVPRSHSAYAEAYRLREFLSIFVPVLPADIPQTSLIREFIGGSGFSY